MQAIDVLRNQGVQAAVLFQIDQRAMPGIRFRREGRMLKPALP